eukprot:531983-Rhodomonas_salina.3
MSRFPSYSSPRSTVAPPSVGVASEEGEGRCAGAEGSAGGAEAKPLSTLLCIASPVIVASAPCTSPLQPPRAPSATRHERRTGGFGF